MVLRLVLAASLLAAAGCRFGFAGVPVDGGVVDEGDLAIATDDLTSAASDLATSPDLAATLGFCAQPSLIVCYQFEDGAAAITAHDGSPNRRDLSLSAASEVAAAHDGGALAMTTGSLAHAAHDTLFDAQQLTFEMWIDPTTLPQTGARAGLVDEDGEYGLFIYPSGVLYCSAGGATASSLTGAIVAGTWQKVACSYDGTAVRLSINDAVVATTPNTAPVTTGQPGGLSIGSNSPSGDDFDGLVDDVRIFSIAR